MPFDDELVLTSPKNPRVRAAADLRERRARDETGRTIVDGARELDRALTGGAAVETVFVDDGGLGPAGQATVVRARAAGAEIVPVSGAVLARLAYGDRAEGLVAVVAIPDQSLEALDLGPDPLVVVLEGVEKPGNLGAVLRTAEAAGVAAVVAADPVTDWGNPNVVRSSKGTVFSVPVAAAGTKEVLDWLRGNGIRLVATTPDTDTAHTDVDYRGSVAVAVGTEKEGLTDVVLGAADERVRIPMVGRVNSLNAATAAAVVVYEAVRQRSS
jgi:RNA methyltransferase, TrmH family